jgi:hypothetical protein
MNHSKPARGHLRFSYFLSLLGSAGLAWAAASAPAAPDAANATPNATTPPEAKEAAPKSAVAPPDAPTELRLHFRTEAAEASTNSPLLKLRGADARQQLLATTRLANGALRDQTHQVAYEASPEGIVRVEPGGLVVPLQDGQATITAKTATGLSSSLAVAVEKFKESAPLNFANQIVPIFTKAGCNGGGCHGKSAGQNGFRLSLLGFEPGEDYEHLVKEARGRRLFPAAPDRSLLLLKGSATLPHGGGKRLDPESDDYRLLVRWMAQGMPYGSTNDPMVDRIEVLPRQRVMPLNGEQQLVVLAHYTDGSIEDVTRSALYEPNDKDMAKADETGEVKLYQQPGDVAVMVRYQGKVTTFRATIPLGAPVENLPPPRNFIDEQVFRKLKMIGMPPSEPSDDATFLRRVSIDIAGRLPTPEEAQRFVADKDPAKRDKVIDTLLDSPDYADYFANKWGALLRNKRNDGNQTHGTYSFHAWIRDSLLVNKPFDQFVREILAAAGDIGQNPPVAWYRQVNNPTSQMEDTAQLLLGQRLQCAQCHHHPYEKWSQHDYYSFSAFFSRVGRKAGSQPGEEVIFHKRGIAEATNKKTKQAEKPAGLGSAPVALTPEDDPRQALVDWMTSKDNRYFAKSLVNRYWKHFFNRGLVEPEDDMRETNPPTNPELLDALAAHFMKSGYDLKDLVRTITQSRTYQLSALPNHYNGIDKQNYSRYYPRRLSAEVLFDAVNQVTKSEAKWDGLPVGTRAVCLPDNSFNASAYFLQVFGRPESASACECERSQDASLAQSLHLLNSKDIQAKIADDKGRAAMLAAEKNRSDEEKIREVYRWSYARDAKPEEMQIAQAHLEKGANKTSDEKGNAVNGKRLAYEDIVWALINTKEFLFNH